MKQTAALGISILAAVLIVAPAVGECIEYGDYLHIVGTALLPGGALGVAVEGNHAYVSITYHGFAVIDLSDYSNPVVVGGLPSIYGNGVAASGDYVYLASDSLHIVDVSNRSDPGEVGAGDSHPRKTPGHRPRTRRGGMLSWAARA